MTAYLALRRPIHPWTAFRTKHRLFVLCGARWASWLAFWSMAVLVWSTILLLAAALSAGCAIPQWLFGERRRRP